MATTEIRPATRDDELLRTLIEIAELIRELTSPQQLAAQMAERVRRLLCADAANIYWWNEGSGFLENIHGQGESLRPGQGIPGEAFAQQRAVLVPAPAPDADACTDAAVPLTVAQRTLGVLAVRNEGPRPCTSGDLSVLILLATFIAPALDRARWQTKSESQRQSATEQSERLTHTLEQLPSGVMVLDSRGFVVLANPAARRMANLQIDYERPWADQFRGYVSCDPLGRWPLAEHETPAARVLAGELVQGTELLVRTATTNVDLWLRVDGVPLRDAVGRTTGAVLVYTDITRERMLARDLAATALEHAKLLGKLAERKERLEHLAGQVGEPWVQPAQIERLTPRDREILRMVARGLTNREIASTLHLSPGTVRNEVGRLLIKLGATDRTQAAVMAARYGVLDHE